MFKFKKSLVKIETFENYKKTINNILLNFNMCFNQQ